MTVGILNTVAEVDGDFADCGNKAIGRDEATRVECG